MEFKPSNLICFRIFYFFFKSWFQKKYDVFGLKGLADLIGVLMTSFHWNQFQAGRKK